MYKLALVVGFLSALVVAGGLTYAAISFIIY